jgi:ketosteroid isomerase-like protein
MQPRKEPSMTATATATADTDTDTAAVLERYTRAFTQHDPSLLESLVAPDCTIERSRPDADGTHLVGRAACLANWQALAANRAGRFTIEELAVMGGRGLVFWHYRFGPGPADAQRGLSVLEVRDGLIVGGRGYVKAAA